MRQELSVSALEKGHRYKLFISVPGAGWLNYTCVDVRTGEQSQAESFEWLATSEREDFIIKFAWNPGHPTVGYISVVDQDTSEDEQKGFRAPAITTNSAIGLESLIKDYFIKSSCVEVSNITFSGGSNQRGSFNNGATSIGFQDGFMMATGGINVARGPNLDNGAAIAPAGPINADDPDLSILLSGNQNNVAKIEFDFIPENSTISFDYVFASEEYCDYTNSAFNDVFGFFLSGPGLAGPFSNNAVNLALIPSTTQFVSINNVNHVDNSAYYRGNIPIGQAGSTGGNCAGHPLLPFATPSVQDCQFDGFTVPLTARANVTPCETYHIKLAIADIQDDDFDSGVFFKLNSFNAGDGSKAEVVYDINNPTAAMEGCSEVYYILTKPLGSAGLPYTITFTNNASSTATAGLDYVPFPLSYVIPADKDTIHVHIRVLTDLLSEPNETIILNLQNGCFCTPPQVILNIQDRPVLNVDMQGDTVCSGGSVTLSPDVSGGIPGYTYVWSDNSTGSELVVNTTGPSVFYVTVSDNCNQSKVDSASIYILPEITASISGDTSICSTPLGHATIKVQFTGPGPWQVTILKDGSPFTSFTTSNNPYFFTTNQPGSYTIATVANTATLCEGPVSGSANITLATLDLGITPTPYACLSSPGAIDLQVSGGFPGYTYQWSGGLGNMQDPANVNSGTYSVTVTDTKGCSNVISTTVIALPPLAANGQPSLPQNCNGGGTISVNPTGGTPNYQYTWSNIGAGGPTQSLVPSGNYQVTITDDNGCTATAALVVGIDTIAPTANAGPGGLINCNNPTLQLNGNGSTVAPGVVYSWEAFNGGNIQSGGNTLMPTVNAGGIYVLTVTNNSNGCSRTDSVTVQADFIAPQVEIADPAILTCAVDTIEIDASASSFGSNFIYQWTTSGGNIISGQGTPRIKVNKVGTYSLQIRNSTNGCVTLRSVTVTEDKVKPDAVAGPTKTITCEFLNVTLDGGNSTGPDFVYQWTTTNGSIVSGEDALNPTVDAPGLYTLVIENTSNGCKDTASVTVLINQVYPTAIGGPDTIVNCYRPTVKLNAAGSHSGAGYSITWSTLDGNILAGGNTLQPTVDAQGTYQITVRNTVNGCESYDEVLVVDLRSYPDIFIDPPYDLNCAVSEQLINASNSSWGPEFTYQWTTQGGHIVSDANTPYPTIDDDGTYTFTVTNILNGCTSSQSIEVISNYSTPVVVVADADSITCLHPQVNLNANGSSSGGVYQIQWSTADGSITGGQSTLTPTVNAAGTYVLTITHMNSLCVSKDSVTVVADANIPVSNAGLPDTLNCTVTLVQLNGSVSGGNNLDYAWTVSPGGNIESGGTSLSPTVDAPGTYTLTVTNPANSCVNSSSVTIALDTLSPDILIQPVPVLNCKITALTLDATQSTSGQLMSYHWATLDGAINGSTSQLTAQTSTPGTYVLTINNNQNHCSQSGSITVLQDTVKPEALLGGSGVLTCENPVFTIDGSGSSTGPRITYAWTSVGGNIISPPNAANINVDQGGLYQIIVLDTVNHCADTASLNIAVDKLTPIADAGDTDSLTCTISELTLEGSISGTTNPIDIRWKTGNGNLVSGANTLNPVVDQAGDYWIVLVDPDNGCTDSAMVTITKNDNIPLAAIQFNGVITCDQTSVMLDGNGSSSSPGITYTWTTQDGQFGSGTNGLTPTVTEGGTYTLTVFDPANNCSATKSITVLADTALPKLLITAEILTCKNPSITLNGDLISDPNTASYGVQWTTSNGHIVSGGNSLDPVVDQVGTYVLGVSSQLNGCDNSAQVTVTEDKQKPTVEAGSRDTLNCAVTVLALDGAGTSTGSQFTYDWTSAGGNITQGANTLQPQIDAPGNYVLSVTDTVNGCSQTDQVTIIQDIVRPNANAGAPIVLTCRDSLLPLNAGGSSGHPLLEFNWTSADGHIVAGANTVTPQVNEGGTYVVVVTNPQNFCKDTAQVIATEDKVAPDALVQQADTITCTQKTVTLQGSTTYTGPVKYSWTTVNGNITAGGNTLNPTVNAVGVYVLLVENTVNGCVGSFPIQVVQDANVPIAVAGPPDTLTCLITQVQLNGNNSSSGSNFEYEWKTSNGNILSGGNTLNPVVNAAGTYELVVLNKLSACDASSFVQVAQDIAKPLADAGQPVLISCAGNSAQLDGSGSSSGWEFTYQWTSLGAGNVLNPTQPHTTVDAEGQYRLIVIDQSNGCRDTSEVLVSRDLPIAELEVHSPFCPGFLGDIQVLGIQGGTAPYELSFDGGAFGDDLSFNQLEPGVYEIRVRDALGCEYKDTLEVSSPDDFQVALNGIDTIQLGEGYQLKASVDIPLDQIKEIIWSPDTGLSCTNCLDPFVTPFSTTKYTLTLITEQGCESRGTFTIKVKRPEIFVPTIFSPNGDSKNDNITVFANTVSVRRVNRFLVFDRWGELIFENGNFVPNDLAAGWNGKLHGQDMNPAVFVWWAEAEAIDGEIIYAQGDFTLVR